MEKLTDERLQLLLDGGFTGIEDFAAQRDLRMYDFLPYVMRFPLIEAFNPYKPPGEIYCRF